MIVGVRRLGNYLCQIILDALKFNNVFTGNIMKEGITVINLLLKRAVPTVVTTERESESGKDRGYDRNNNDSFHKYILSKVVSCVKQNFTRATSIRALGVTFDCNFMLEKANLLNASYNELSVICI